MNPIALLSEEPHVGRTPDELADIYLTLLKEQWGHLYQLRGILCKSRFQRWFYQLEIRRLIRDIQDTQVPLETARLLIVWSKVNDPYIDVQVERFEKSLANLLLFPPFEKLFPGYGAV